MKALPLADMDPTKVTPSPIVMLLLAFKEVSEEFSSIIFFVLPV
jgi:hypothetical protein